jgi:hypothetical protein
MKVVEIMTTKVNDVVDDHGDEVMMTMTMMMTMMTMMTITI